MPYHGARTQKIYACFTISLYNRVLFILRFRISIPLIMLLIALSSNNTLTNSPLISERHKYHRISFILAIDRIRCLLEFCDLPLNCYVNIPLYILLISNHIKTLEIVLEQWFIHTAEYFVD